MILVASSSIPIMPLLQGEGPPNLYVFSPISRNQPVLFVEDPCSILDMSVCKTMAQPSGIPGSLSHHTLSTRNKHVFVWPLHYFRILCQISTDTSAIQGFPVLAGSGEQFLRSHLCEARLREQLAGETSEALCHRAVWHRNTNVVMTRVGVIMVTPRKKLNINMFLFSNVVCSIRYEAGSDL